MTGSGAPGFSLLGGGPVYSLQTVLTKQGKTMKVFAGVLVAASWVSLTAYAACESPPLPEAIRGLPDGAAATQAEIAAARADVRAHMAILTAYIACMDEELEAASEETPPELKSIIVNRRNAAVGEQESVAAAFNRQLRAFQAAHPEEKAASQPSSSTGSSAGSQAPPQ